MIGLRTPAGTGASDRGRFPELEELAEISLVLLRAPLRLGLAALVVERGVEEAAVLAALEVREAVGAGGRPLDRVHQRELATAVVTDLHAPPSAAWATSLVVGCARRFLLIIRRPRRSTLFPYTTPEATTQAPGASSGASPP